MCVLLIFTIHPCASACPILGHSWAGVYPIQGAPWMGLLEAFLRDVGPYWHGSITQWLQIYRLHVDDVNLPLHHILKVLC